MFLRLEDISSPYPLLIRIDQIRVVYFDDVDRCVCVELLNGDIYQTSSSIESIYSLLSSRF